MPQVFITFGVTVSEGAFAELQEAASGPDGALGLDATDVLTKVNASDMSELGIIECEFVG